MKIIITITGVLSDIGLLQQKLLYTGAQFKVPMNLRRSSKGNGMVFRDEEMDSENIKPLGSGHTLENKFQTITKGGL